MDEWRGCLNEILGWNGDVDYRLMDDSFNDFVREREMKPKTTLVLELAIKQGIDYGWMRAHKHTDTPDENLIKQEIEEAIWHEVYSWFDLEVNDE